MLDDHDILSYLNHEKERIAFHGIPGKSPGLFFLGGFASDMTGAKATYLAALARTQGLAFTRFDYSGHGKSTGTIEDGDIGHWLSDALAIFDQVTSGDQILVGSSMGGWIALLLAKLRPQRVKGIVGIAAAPDFTEDLMWAELSDSQKKTVLEQGRLQTSAATADSHAIVITRQLIESGREHLVMRAPLALDCPVRLIHGMNDRDVPWQVSTKLADVLNSTDVRITLIKDGEHRLSRDSDMEIVRGIVGDLTGYA